MNVTWTLTVAVDGGDVVEGPQPQPQSNVPGIDRLTERDLDVGDLVLYENFLATRGQTFGVVEKESVGQHPHP